MKLNRIRKIIDFLKRAKRVIDSYDHDLHYGHVRVTRLEAVIKERTELNVDISPSRHGRSHVVLVGRYNGRDYVESFSLDDREFSNMVCRLREMERYAFVNRVDAPPTFRGVFEKELRK